MSHRTIVHWDQWLNKGLGQLVLRTEQGFLKAFLSGKYGKHAVLIGVPPQDSLIETLDLPCHSLLTPLAYHRQGQIKAIESSLYELPLASASVDLVILPHTLELVDNPRQLLAEACRIVRPEGYLIICGFNRYSLWALSRQLKPKNPNMPAYHSLKQGVLKKWLHLSDFELVQEAHALYSPPIQSERFLEKLRFMEWLGSTCHLPWGAIYVLMARAKVVPLTPIRLRWQQSIAGMRVPTSIPGPTVRTTK